jgi:hypothetical protein
VPAKIATNRSDDPARYAKYDGLGVTIPKSGYQRRRVKAQGNAVHDCVHDTDATGRTRRFPPFGESGKGRGKGSGDTEAQQTGGGRARSPPTEEVQQRRAHPHPERKIGQQGV